MYLLEEEMYWCPTGAMIIKVEKDEMLTLIAFYIFTLSSSIARTLCNSLNCEHGCKSSLEGGVCTCPKGKKVADDNKSCVGKSSHKNTSPSEIFLVLKYISKYVYIYFILFHLSFNKNKMNVKNGAFATSCAKIQ